MGQLWAGRGGQVSAGDVLNDASFIQQNIAALLVYPRLPTRTHTRTHSHTHTPTRPHAHTHIAYCISCVFLFVFCVVWGARERERQKQREEEREREREGERDSKTAREAETTHELPHELPQSDTCTRYRSRVPRKHKTVATACRSPLLPYLPGPRPPLPPARRRRRRRAPRGLATGPWRVMLLPQRLGRRGACRFFLSTALEALAAPLLGGL